MAKISGAMLSLGARGSIAKTMVFAKWRGVAYARQHVIPTNPNTTAQQRVRSTFALLREAWKTAPAEILNAWNSFAQGRPFLGVNKWVGENVRVLNNEVLMTDTIFSPGAKGGPAPATFVPVTGGAAGEIDFTFTLPVAPNGWTINSVVVAGLPDQIPQDFFVGPFVGVTVAAPTLVGTIDGFPTGDDIVVGGWLLWNKPDGTIAYSVSISDTVAAG